MFKKKANKITQLKKCTHSFCLFSNDSKCIFSPDQFLRDCVNNAVSAATQIRSQV